jgi:hypothetical protein
MREIEWPACAVHGGHPETSVWDGDEPVDVIDDVVWWRCTNTGYALATVGRLTAKIAKTPAPPCPCALNEPSRVLAVTRWA